jgi:hypothetical protein
MVTILDCDDYWGRAFHTLIHHLYLFFGVYLFINKRYLGILNISLVLNIWLKNIFFHPVDCLFTLLVVSFVTEEYLSLILSHFSIIAFVVCTFCVISRRSFLLWFHLFPLAKHSSHVVIYWTDFVKYLGCWVSLSWYGIEFCQILFLHSVNYTNCFLHGFSLSCTIYSFNVLSNSVC